MRWNTGQRETLCTANTMWVHSAFPRQPGSMLHAGFLSFVAAPQLMSFVIPEEAVFEIVWHAKQKCQQIKLYITKHITSDVIPHIVSHIPILYIIVFLSSYSEDPKILSPLPEAVLLLHHLSKTTTNLTSYIPHMFTSSFTNIKSDASRQNNR